MFNCTAIHSRARAASSGYVSSWYKAEHGLIYCCKQAHWIRVVGVAFCMYNNQRERCLQAARLKEVEAKDRPLGCVDWRQAL